MGILCMRKLEFKMNGERDGLIIKQVMWEIDFFGGKRVPISYYLWQHFKIIYWKSH
jgi:hypothetical protein